MLPDKLVQAAAEAIHDYTDDPDFTLPVCWEVARLALAAAFAALPECEAVLKTCEMVMQKHLPVPLPEDDAKHPGWVMCMCHGYAENEGPNLTLFVGPVPHRQHVARLQAEALAREFGEPNEKSNND